MRGKFKQTTPHWKISFAFDKDPIRANFCNVQS